MREGLVTRLTTESALDSVRRRQEVMAAVPTTATARSVAQATANSPARERLAGRQPSAATEAVSFGPENATWPLLLGGLGATACLLASLRRRQRR
jgi:hypothetical protein